VVVQRVTGSGGTESYWQWWYRELLALVVFVKQFRHYVWGNHFKIRTDHVSLVWLKNFKDPQGILARWLSILDTYDFTLEHRKGSLHTNADSLSRIPHKKMYSK
jgi:hypothetical protein